MIDHNHKLPISRQTKLANFYFAHPYASRDRGTNVNTNGLIRQHFPKNCDFTTLTQQEIDMAMERLNNKPKNDFDVRCPIRYALMQALHFILKSA